MRSTIGIAVKKATDDDDQMGASRDALSCVISICFQLYVNDYSVVTVQLILSLTGNIHYPIFTTAVRRSENLYSTSRPVVFFLYHTNGTTDHYHPSSNLGVCIFERCFISDYASLPLEVARPIYPTPCAQKWP